MFEWFIIEKKDNSRKQIGRFGLKLHNYRRKVWRQMSRRFKKREGENKNRLHVLKNRLRIFAFTPPPLRVTPFPSPVARWYNLWLTQGCSSTGL